MHPEWAKLCSEASAGESDFAACFSDNVAQMLYSNEIQRQAFEFIVNANGMRAELVAFKACVPAQYRSLEVPADSGVLDTRGLVSTASVAGDTKLVSQLQYLRAFHEVLKSATALAALRSTVDDNGEHTEATCGEPGGITAVGEETVGQLNTVRECLTLARAVHGANGMQTAFKTAQDSPSHLPHLDEFSDPAMFGPLRNQARRG